jgi:hypothetical protein
MLGKFTEGILPESVKQKYDITPEQIIAQQSKNCLGTDKLFISFV